ncbi:MAG: T9SS type A sorting domain-containing protein [Bacteroidales bacterium]|nr:T9SS type A sorting domain-containing protein [Bacteroidales bacterium]
MKKIIFIITILFSYHAIKAQNNYFKMIDTNKVWNNIGTNPPWLYTKYYKFSNDTVLNGITYHWLKESTDSVNWIKSALIREDTISRKVFLYGYSNGVFTGGEGLIYDFSVSIDDTVALFNPVMCGDTCRIIITDIDSVLVGNQYRKKFIFDILPSPHCFQLSNFFIEGIGYEYGVYDIGGGLVGGFLPRLVCYHENASVMYVNPYYGSCITTIIGIEDYAEQQLITIESRGNNAFLVKANEELKEISIFNITGQKSVNISFNKDEAEFNLSIYPKGIYFIKILTVNNKGRYKKIIKL